VRSEGKARGTGGGREGGREGRGRTARGSELEARTREGGLGTHGGGEPGRARLFPRSQAEGVLLSVAREGRRDGRREGGGDVRGGERILVQGDSSLVAKDST